MFNGFERAVAGRYLRARRGERFVSVIAVFSILSMVLGVATLIIVMSVMGGFQVDLLNRILGFNGHLGVYGQSTLLTNYADLARRIEAVPGVESASPVIDGQVLFSGPRGQNAGGIVRGMRPEDIVRLPSIANNVRDGSLKDFKGEDAIAIGVGLAAKFGLQAGDELTLISPQGAATAFGTVPRVRAYHVVAVFQVGMNEYDTSFVFLPLEAAQIFFQKPGQATHIEVVLKDAGRVRPLQAAVTAALSADKVRVVNWEENNNSFFAAVQVEKNVMFLILTLIILVAAFSIISSLIMMVKDKTRDIAILRTVGAGRWAVMRIFLMCGASIGILGTGVGVLIGVLFCANIQRIQGWVEAATGARVFNPEVYYLTHLPARLDPGEVLQVTVLALVLSILATLYPSWRAARTDPVEALRHE